MWSRAKFYSSKIGGLGLALLAVIAALIVWNRTPDSELVLLPHFSSLMNLMLLVMGTIVLVGTVAVTAHRAVIARRMNQLRA